MSTLKLRALEPSDADFLYKAENEYTAVINSDNAAPYSRDLLQQYAESYDADPYRSGQLRLVADVEGESVGIIDIYDISVRNRHASVAILVLPEYRNLGYASEMLESASEFAFKSLGLVALMSLVHTTNSISVSLFEKCGFDRCGILKRWHFSDGDMHDVIVMQLCSKQD